MKKVTRDELKGLIDEEGEYILIDVREKVELEHGMIPTAKHVALSEFSEALDLSPEDFEKKYGFAMSKSDRVILYCRSGNRSGQAAEYAESKGFNAANYEGSVLEWSEIDPGVKAY